MGKDTDKGTQKVEPRQSKAFLDPGSTGSSAAEETPAASHLRALDERLSGGSGGASGAVIDDQASRLAAVDEQFAGFDNATQLSEAQERLGAIDAKFAGSDNAGGARPGQWGPSDDPQFAESDATAPGGIRGSLADDEAYSEGAQATEGTTETTYTTDTGDRITE